MTVTEPTPEAVPTPVADPAAVAPAGGPAAGATNADSGVGGGAPTLSPEASAAELKRARDEAAASRIEAKRFKDAFEGYEDDEVAEALAMYRAITENPAEAHKKFAATTERIKKHLEETGQLSPEGAADPKYLTREDLKAIEDERALENAVQGILRETTALGYTEGTPEHKHLLDVAARETNGDVQAAHAKILGGIDAIKKAAVQEYVDSLSTQRHPPVSTGNAGNPVTPAPGGKIDPKKSALARLTAAGY